MGREHEEEQVLRRQESCRQRSWKPAGIRGTPLPPERGGAGPRDITLGWDCEGQGPVGAAVALEPKLCSEQMVVVAVGMPLGTKSSVPGPGGDPSVPFNARAAQGACDPLPPALGEHRAWSGGFGQLQGCLGQGALRSIPSQRAGPGVLRAAPALAPLAGQVAVTGKRGSCLVFRA